MSNSIRLSPKHGVNPALVACFICGEDTNEIALLGRLRGEDREAPRRISLGSACDRCKGIIDGGGVFIIEAVENSEGEAERTGRVSAVKSAAFDRIFTCPRPPL